MKSHKICQSITSRASPNVQRKEETLKLLLLKLSEELVHNNILHIAIEVKVITYFSVIQPFFKVLVNCLIF